MTVRGKSKQAGRRPRRQMLALEPRLLFDGAAAATAEQQHEQAQAAALAAAVADVAAQATEQPLAALAEPSVPAHAEAPRRELMVVDTRIPEWQSLVAKGRPDVQVLLLDGGTDPLAQIAAAIGDQPVDALHLIAHGDPGSVRLGSLELDRQAVDRNAGALAELGSRLTANGDILLYGCLTGAGTGGQLLIEALARITSADIAASTNLTGAAALGGDWVLEARAGTVEAQLFASAEELAGYRRLLALPVVDLNQAAAFIASDNFATQTYTGGVGWTSGWIEFDASPDGGGDSNNSPTGKNVELLADGGGGFEVRIEGHGQQVPRDYIQRSLNLLPYTTATLSFTYRMSGLEADDTVSVEVSSNGGATFTVVDVLPTVGVNTPRSFDISGLISDRMVIRFGTNTGFTNTDDLFYFDNVSITADGNNYDVSYVEDGTPVNIAASTITVSDPDGGQMQGAVIQVANAQAGDWLTPGALLGGITASGPGTTITLSGLASAAQYAQTIRNITYSTTSDTPNTTVMRQVTVRVTDDAGEQSAASTAFIRVANADDPMVAQPDTFNVASFGSFSGNVLANNGAGPDTDPDGVLTVSPALVTSPINGTVTMATDGTFVYTPNPLLIGTDFTDSFQYRLESLSQVPGVNYQFWNSMPAGQSLLTGFPATPPQATGFLTTYDVDTPALLFGGPNPLDTFTVRFSSELLVTTPGTYTFWTGSDDGSLLRVNGVVVVNNDGDHSFRERSGATFLTAGRYTLVVDFHENGGQEDLQVAYAGPDTQGVRSDLGGAVGLLASTFATGNVTINAFSTAPRLDLDGDNSTTTGTGFAGTWVDAPRNVPPVGDSDVVVTDTNNVTLQSGRIAIANPQPGDRLVIVGTVPSSITATLAPDQRSIALAGNATLADYQAAIAAIGFDNTSANPVTTTRTINVTVNDGAYDSNTATATITISSPNDPPVAVNDVVITPQNAPITFDPRANDSDPEAQPLTVTQFNGTNLVTGAPVALTGVGTITRNADGTLTFTPNSGYSGSSPFAYTLSDGSLTSTATVTLNVNAAPVLDLNGAAAGTGYTTTYTENGAAVAIVDTGAVAITDPNASDGITRATVTLLNAQAGDVLEISGSLPAGITSSLVGNVLTLTGAATRSDYQAALAAVRFRVPGEAPSASARSAQIVVYDGALYSNVAAATLNVAPVNDAPILADTVLTLPAISEDAGAPSGAVGVLVSTLVGGQSDPDGPGALQGIAITDTSTSGTWRYSIDNGASWNIFTGTPAGARLLAADGNTRLHFQPNANFNGTIPAAITFRAWDRTTGTNGGTASTVSNGGMTPFSAGTDVVAVTVNPVNDAPVLADTTLTMTVAQNAGSPSGAVGSPVSALLAGISDVDAGAVGGIAITATTETNGTWWYTTDGGASWTPVGAVSGTSSLLLADDPDTRLYFAPNTGYSGASSPLTLRAWDQTTGTAGTKVSTATNGGTTAFSSATDTISVTVATSPPQVDLSGSTTASAIDTFVGTNYTGASGGTIPWTGDWLETDLDGGGATGGDAQIVPQGGSNRIRLGDDNPQNGGTTPAALRRELNLSAYTNAQLSFDLSTSNNLEGADSYVVEVSRDGGLTWVPLQSYSNDLTSAQSISLAGYESSSTLIQFRLTSNFDAGEYVYVDNAAITAQVATTIVTDNLGSGGYAGVSGGAIAWSGNWTESDPEGAFLSASEGDVQVNAGRIRLSDDNANNGGTATARASIWRTVDLSNYLHARLSFDLSTSGTVDATDNYAAEVSSDGGLTYATLGAYSDDVTGTQTFSLAGYESAATVIRFRLTSDFAGGEYVFIDNIAIRGEPTAWTNPTAYVENGAPVVFAATGATITDDGANLNGLSVLLGNYVAGDRITIDGSTIVLTAGASGTTSGSGIGYTVGVSGGTATLTLSATRTVSAYQTILRNAQFDSTSDDPTVGDTKTTRTFSVRAFDGGGVPSNLAVATVAITSVNDAPTVTNPIPDQNATEDAAFSFAFAANTYADVDVGDTLTYSAQLAGGGALPAWLSFNAATRTFSGTPTNDDVGAVSIEVIAADGNGGTVNDTFTITVANTNDAPTDLALSNSTVAENAAGALIGTVSVTDPDAGGSHTYTVDDARFEVVGGQLKLVAGASLNFEAEPTVDVTVTATDQGGLTYNETFTLTVTDVNEAPSLALNNPVTTIAENTVIGAGYKVADIALADDALGTNVLSLSGADAASFTIVGTELFYTGASPNFEAKSSYAVSVAVDDAGVGASPDASVNFTLTVTDVNEAPTAANDLASTPINAPVTIAVLANDTDVEPGALTVSAATVAPAEGSVVINGDGTLTFTPALNFSGVATITYTVTDAGWLTDTATVAVSVGANTPPTGANATRVIAEDGSYTLLAADFGFADADLGQSLANVRIDSLPAAGTLRLNGAAVAANAVISVADIAAGLLVFAPDADASGAPYASFTFSVQDSAGAYDAAPNTFTLDVTAVNDAPVANPDTVTTAEDTPLAGNVLANDTDVDGPALAVSQFTVAGVPGTFAAGATANIAGLGALTIAANGDFTFTPAPDYNGPGPVATYTVTDGALATTGTLTVTAVTAVNDLPVAVDVATAGTEDSPARIVIALAGTDVDGAVVTYTLASLPANGQVFAAATGGAPLTAGAVVSGPVYFAPAADWNGVASFGYRATDNDGATSANVATAAVTIAPVNDAPIANPDTVSTTEDTPATFDVRANDTDADSASLAVTHIDGTPIGVGGSVTVAGGSVTRNADGTLTFVSAPDYNGTPSFTYSVDDGSGGTATATVTLDVTAVNDPALVSGDAAGTVAAGNASATGGRLGVTDPDAGEALFRPAAGASAFGAFSIDAAGNWTFSLDGANPAVAALQQGQSLVDAFDVLTADGTVQRVTITIVGTGARASDVAPYVLTYPPNPFVPFAYEPLPGRAYAPPFVPAAFVLAAVAESQQLLADQAAELSSAPNVQRAGTIRSASIGAGLGVDPSLHVLPAVADVRALMEDVQGRVSAVYQASLVGSETLFTDLGPQAPTARGLLGAAPSPSVEVVFPAPSRADATPGVSHDADMTLESAALLLPRATDAHAAGNVPSAAPSFTAQLKDAAARMRPVPLPGTGAARKA